MRLFVVYAINKISLQPASLIVESTMWDSIQILPDNKPFVIYELSFLVDISTILCLEVLNQKLEYSRMVKHYNNEKFTILISMCSVYWGSLKTQVLLPLLVLGRPQSGAHMIPPNCHPVSHQSSVSVHLGRWLLVFLFFAMTLSLLQ